ncbi:MAG: ATP synthase F1 subunit gamma [Chloroflexi bacterium]|nr:ATP synthase F1 subunit gamma [Chloroflexota bacterium]
MPGLREIRRRIRSVKNIRQITMALEAVSASKVRRATAQALSARAYANAAMQVLTDIASASGSIAALHPLLASREQVGTVTICLITSDRGLSGAYNTNVIRVARQFAQHIGRPVRWVAVGRKGRDALVRLRENVTAEFTGLPAWWTIDALRPIRQVLVEDFQKGYADEVYVAYTEFINMLAQKPMVQRLLPLAFDERSALNRPDYLKMMEKPEGRVADYIFEPSAAAILEEIVPKFIENILFELVLESQASEHSARMVAMRNASDNAKALIDDLTLSYNKARQAAITAEILDIVGGVEALRAQIGDI